VLFRSEGNLDFARRAIRFGGGNRDILASRLPSVYHHSRRLPDWQWAGKMSMRHEGRGSTGARAA
jgi:hypothetical protein